MSVLERFEKEWAVIRLHPWKFAFVAVFVGGVSFAASSWHYQGRIDGLMETLETRQFPAPVVRHIPVPVTDPTSAAMIASLNSRLDLQGQTIENLTTALVHRAPAPAPTKTRSAPPIAPAIPPATNSFSNQSGGVALGSNGSIGTVNQNGLAARSKFAAQLGSLYTEGYLLEQKIGVKNSPPEQIDNFDHEGGAWQKKVIDFMNANMCSDAAAYFLKFHRSSLSYGLPEKQNGIFDSIASNLDNLSDIKRNDAWDCK
jgi:hypothetical protein